MVIIKSPRRQERYLPLVIDKLSGGGCVIWDGVPRTETESYGLGWESHLRAEGTHWDYPFSLLLSDSQLQTATGNYSCWGNGAIQNSRKAFVHWPFFCQPHISHHALLIVPQCFPRMMTVVMVWHLPGSDAPRSFLPMLSQLSFTVPWSSLY